MNKIVECVPNFSEGRDEKKLEQLVAAIAAVSGVVVLDREMDANHNRAVISFAGEPTAVVEAAVRAARRAAELIDLNTHTGEHPRMGALDVLPFIPIHGVTIEDCVQLAHRAGERIASELKIPVYLYEHAANRPDRVNLADVRRGEFEGLRREIGLNPDRQPDFGDPLLHPTAGAIAIGARHALIAYNINLGTTDLTIAKKIAKAVRGRDGGLQYVKALAFDLKDRGQVQVSLNLVNHEATPMFRAFEMVRLEAERYGVPVVGSEIVGLAPQAALTACADFYLRLENFRDEQVLETRLHAALWEQAPPPGRAAEQGERATTTLLGPFADEIAEGKPTPGGGSVAAYAGALAAALGAMVCNLTIGKKRFADIEHEARDILTQLEQVGADLRQAVSDDAESFDRVLAAKRLPGDSDGDRLARESAAEQATKNAAAVPLRVAESAMEVLELLDELLEIGNPQAFSDLAVGAQMALTALRGAYYNVLANLATISDEDFKRRQREILDDLLARGQEVADEIEAEFMSRYGRQS